MRFTIWTALSAATLIALTGTASAQEDSGSDEGSKRWSFETYLAEAHSFGQANIDVGPSSISVDWQDITLGEEASQDLRSVVDGMFDSESKDGVVSDDEYEDFANAFRLLIESQFGNFAAEDDYAGLVRIDQSSPESAEVTLFEAEGLTGAVDQSGQIVADVGLLINFEATDSDETLHTVKLDMGPYYFKEGKEDKARDVAGDFVLTVGPAADWNIDPESIQPDCVAQNYQDGELVFTGEDVSCFTGPSDGPLLAFAIETEPSHFLPGPGGALFALALASMAIVLRRRQ